MVYTLFMLLSAHIYYRAYNISIHSLLLSYLSKQGSLCPAHVAKAYE